MTTESRRYRKALTEAKRHHLSSKTYSGKLLRPHKEYLGELIRSHGIESALDYGCGKGEQYNWQDPEDGGRTIEESWGFEVRKFDPAWPPYATEPVGRWDLVICTHTLGSIPIADHPWVIDRLLGHAAKVLFVAEKIGPIKKRVHGAREGFVNGWGPDLWIAALHTALEIRCGRGFEVPAVHFSYVTPEHGEKITRRVVI